MAQEYIIEGMSCGNCVRHIKEAVSELDEVKVLKVQLEKPQITLESDRNIQPQEIQQKVGNRYVVLAIEMKKTEDAQIPKSMTTYKPLILIVAFLIGVTILAQYPFETFSGTLWMRHFMAGFFLAFSFFKLMNLRGFTDSYAMYDLLAARWHTWGLLYPFVELALGVSYLIGFMPFYTNLATVIILGFSSIGVIQSVLDKRKIKCACLGDVFNLPMSTVTIVEDLAMVGMAAAMLFML